MPLVATISKGQLKSPRSIGLNATRILQVSALFAVRVVPTMQSSPVPVTIEHTLVRKLKLAMVRFSFDPGFSISTSAVTPVSAFPLE